MASQGKKKLVLMPSVSMDRNKKESRNEHSLIRMAAKTRTFLGFTDDKVEIWPSDSSVESVLLNIYHAFSTDINRVKKLLRQGEITANDLNRIGFVTTKMYNRITGGNADKNIWISAGVHDTVVGADPEFLLFNDSGRVIRANNVMSKSGVIGCDGAMAEVRPAPSTTPEGIVKHLREAFSNKSLTAAIEQYEWRAGCYYRDDNRDYTMGGHIHVGNPAKVARIPLSKREMYFNVMNKIMDELVAIPCMRLDGDMGKKRRTQCQIHSGGGGFGWFGEWRTCNGRLEHRTLSGMWLMHPSVAKCVIGTAKAVTDAIFKNWSEHGFSDTYMIAQNYSGVNRSEMNANGFDGWKHFAICKEMGTTLSSSGIRKILHDSRGGDINKTWLRNWLATMKKLPTYSSYSKYIRGLLEILKVNMNELGSWDRRIQTNWLGSKKFLVDV